MYHDVQRMIQRMMRMAGIQFMHSAIRFWVDRSMARGWAPSAPFFPPFEDTIFFRFSGIIRLKSVLRTKHRFSVKIRTNTGSW